MIGDRPIGTQDGSRIIGLSLAILAYSSAAWRSQRSGLTWASGRAVAMLLIASLSADRGPMSPSCMSAASCYWTSTASISDTMAAGAGRLPRVQRGQ
jgi:hypothetical protein